MNRLVTTLLIPAALACGALAEPERFAPSTSKGKVKVFILGEEKLKAFMDSFASGYV